MPRPISVSGTVLKVPNQSVHFQGLVHPRTLDIRLLGTLLSYDNVIGGVKQPEVTFRQPDKTMYRKSS